MKYLLYTLFLFLHFKLHATNYYFSITGLDANAGTIAAPWQSVLKFNSMFTTFTAGDSILFKRGDTFYGSFKVTQSGSTSQIVIGAYGTGTNPIFNGLSDVTGFTNIGGNIWESGVNSTNNKPNLVLINNVVKPMGRWPNTGYNFYSAFTTGYIKDAALAGFNFTGGRLCIRKLHDIISNDSITVDNVDTLFSTSISGYNTLAGYGYFVENHSNTLDLEGEWYFNPATKKLSVFSAAAPTNVKISTVDTLCYLGANDNITITGISFQGSNVAGVAFGGPTVGQAVRDTIKDCSFLYSGRNAIYCTYNQFCAIQNNTIYYSLNNGIYCENEGGKSLNINISNNIIKHSGTLPGMGFICTATSDNISYNGITVLGDDAVVTANIVDTVGHVGIAGYYSNTKVRDNNINYHNYITDDGGGINFFDVSFGATTETGIDVVKNTVSNGIGAAAGTLDNTNVANGIYLDDKINGVRIDSNTVNNTVNNGIYLHNVTNISIRQNIINNSAFSAFAVAHDKNATGIPINNIIFASNQITQTKGYNIYMYNFVDGGNLDSMFTKLDSNFFYRPSLTDTAFRTITYIGSTYFNQHLNYNTWKTIYTSAKNGAWDNSSFQYFGLPGKSYFTKRRR